MSNQEGAATTRQLDTAGAVPAQLSVSQEGAVPVIASGSQLLFRISEAMEMLSMSRSEMYKHLQSGRIRSVGRGQARRITAWALLEYVDLLEREAKK
jgi:predicted DNA-binding transcriptional regulator AlpA